MIDHCLNDSPPKYCPRVFTPRALLSLLPWHSCWRGCSPVCRNWKLRGQKNSSIKNIHPNKIFIHKKYSSRQDPTLFHPGSRQVFKQPHFPRRNPCPAHRPGCRQHLHQRLRRRQPQHGSWMTMRTLVTLVCSDICDHKDCPFSGLVHRPWQSQLMSRGSLHTVLQYRGCKQNLFELQIVFVEIANCICQVFPLYLFELQIVFV